MDNGRDLEKSLVGPWNYDVRRESEIKVTLLPVIQHHPKMTWRKIGDVDPMSRPSLNPSYSTGVHKDLPQSIFTLPLNYPSLLSALDLSKRAPSDPLHALIPVFTHAAFSEVAFLNLVDELMDKLTEPLPLDGFQSETFDSLQYFEIILERHAAQIRQCIRSIHVLGEKSPFVSFQNTGPSPGAHNSRSPARHLVAPDSRDHTASQYYQHQHSSFSAAGILEDYEDLLERCTRLLSRVNSAKTSEMNRAMILESRRAIEQAERMKTLTLLACYFIPLTFTASLFGMNFQILGQGKLPIWWYIVFAVPFTLLTHVFCTWNLESLQSKCRNVFRKFRKTRRDVT
jgi:hypothetical protein